LKGGRQPPWRTDPAPGEADPPCRGRPTRRSSVVRGGVVEERGREEGSRGGYRFTDLLDTYQSYHPLPTFYMSIKQHIHGFVKTSWGTTNIGRDTMIYGGAVRDVVVYACFCVLRDLGQRWWCMYIYIHAVGGPLRGCYVSVFLSFSSRSLYILVYADELCVAHYVISSQPNTMWASVFSSCPPSLQKTDWLQIVQLFHNRPKPEEI
jgi:hypothetical protein